MNGFNALKYRFDGRSITPPKRYPSVTSDAVKTPTIKTVNMPKTIMGFRFLVVTLLNFWIIIISIITKVGDRRRNDPYPRTKCIPGRSNDSVASNNETENVGIIHKRNLLSLVKKGKAIKNMYNC